MLVPASFPFWTKLYLCRPGIWARSSNKPPPTHIMGRIQRPSLTRKNELWGESIFIFLSFTWKRNSSLKRKPRGVAWAVREGTASRSGCFQGANLSISSQFSGKKPSLPCSCCGCAAVRQLQGAFLWGGSWPEGVASLFSPSYQLFNWPGCDSAAEPGLGLSLRAPQGLFLSLYERNESSSWRPSPWAPLLLSPR